MTTDKTNPAASVPHTTTATAEPAPRPEPANSKPPAGGVKPAPNPTVEQEAGIASRVLIPAAFVDVADAGGFSSQSLKRHFDDWVKRAKQSDDPVEQLLLEQLLILHHRLARLHCDARAASSADGVRILNGVAARLTGELRKIVLVLRAYRTPPGSRSFTVIEQQNVAHEQDVKLVRARSRKKNVSARRDKQAGASTREAGHERTVRLFGEGSPACGGGQVPAAVE
ncbi:MAG: hypothetical protein ABSH20_27800 [Tepidisphaeraceae bacterium]|jgi:hypothetical protein